MPAEQEHPSHLPNRYGVIGVGDSNPYETQPSGDRAPAEAAPEQPVASEVELAIREEFVVPDGDLPPVPGELGMNPGANPNVVDLGGGIVMSDGVIRQKEDKHELDGQALNGIGSDRDSAGPTDSAE